MGSRSWAFKADSGTRSERPEPYDRTTISEHADDAAALLRALDAVPAVVIGRSYGGETAIDLTLRYPDLVRALVLLEAAVLSFAPEALGWAEALRDKVYAAANRGMDQVGETFIRAVTGDWEGFPEPVRKMFIDNGAAIVAEFRGGFLDVTADDVSKIDVPTLMVAGSDSPEPFRQVTDAMAAAIPNARTALVPGGHLINPAAPPVVEFVREALRS